MSIYATRKDLYTYGLPRGSLGSAPSREVASSRATSNVLELDAHGLEVGDVVTFRAVEGGSMPGGLAEGTKYYAIRIDDARFQVASSLVNAQASTAIDLTTDGESVVMSVPIDVDALLERYSRFADGFLPAHAVPLTEPYPIEVVAAVAELTAARVQFLSGVASVEMSKVDASARKQLERFASGLPLRDATATRPTNLAIRGEAGSTERRLDS